MEKESDMQMDGERVLFVERQKWCEFWQLEFESRTLWAKFWTFCQGKCMGVLEMFDHLLQGQLGSVQSVKINKAW